MLADATVWYVSVYWRIGIPYVPWTRSPAIQKADIPVLSSPIRPAAAAAERSGTRDATTSATSHTNGAIPTRTSDVAFTLPTSATVTANQAAGRQELVPRRGSASRIIHGIAAHGPRMTDSRAR